MNRPAAHAEFDSGSFRDREGRVFYHQDRVYRALSATAFEAWEGLAESRFFPRLMEAGQVVGTRRAELSAEVLEAVRPSPDAPPWAGALEHDRIPFLSFPYEWSFSMLRDAALLQLDLLDAALEEGYTLKDATAYNVQFVGARPVFIDVASFEPWKEGEPWVGYLQFCQLFLYPLLLTAHRDLPFHPWLRGAIDGITPEQANAVFSTWRDRLRSGVLADVYLQAKLHARAAASDQAVRSDVKRAGFKKELIVGNVRRLRKLVGKLSWQRGSSEWGHYAEDNSYDADNRRAKEEFVERAAASGSWRLAWDLGANTGHYSRIAARHAEQVVALDGDHLAVERMYRALASDGPSNILPLYSNLADTSPSLGWRNRERPALTERDQPDLVLALALIHHMVISANVPLTDFVGWLRSLGSHLVLEMVTKDDAMVKKLLRNKPDIYHDYEVETLERCLEQHYEILDRADLQDGTRRIYFARPK